MEFSVKRYGLLCLFVVVGNLAAMEGGPIRSSSTRFKKDPELEFLLNYFAEAKKEGADCPSNNVDSVRIPQPLEYQEEPDFESFVHAIFEFEVNTFFLGHLKKKNKAESWQ